MGKGSTAQQTSIANSGQSFMGTLQNDFGTAFSGQQNILNGLQKTQQSILAAGPGQFGFSVPQTTALNTMATSANAASYQGAKTGIGEQVAATGGGNSVLPTGTQGESLTTAAASAAQNQAASLNKIQQAGYAQGSQDYNAALSGSLQVASIENPSALAGEANKAGDTAFGEATSVNNMNASNNFWPQVGGLAGSLVGSYFGGPIGGYVGGKVGTTVGGVNGPTEGTYTELNHGQG
jgi:hypothetical protein